MAEIALLAISSNIIHFKMRYTDKKLILQMYQLLKDFHDFAEKVGMDYWVCYGTLLGAVRHQGIIPWDDDVDVFSNNAEPLVSNFDLLEELGYEVTQWWFGYRISRAGGERVRATKGYHCPGCDVPIGLQDQDICPCESGYPFIDVFTTLPDDKNDEDEKNVFRHSDMRAEQNFHGRFDRDDVFPLKLYDFGEYQVYGPNNPKPFLDLVYGDDWDLIGREGYQHDTKTYGNGFIENGDWEPAKPSAKPTGPLESNFSGSRLD